MLQGLICHSLVLHLQIEDLIHFLEPLFVKDVFLPVTEEAAHQPQVHFDDSHLEFVVHGH